MAHKNGDISKTHKLKHSDWESERINTKTLPFGKRANPRGHLRQRHCLLIVANADGQFQSVSLFPGFKINSIWTYRDTERNSLHVQQFLRTNISCAVTHTHTQICGNSFVSPFVGNSDKLPPSARNRRRSIIPSLSIHSSLLRLSKHTSQFSIKFIIIHHRRTPAKIKHEQKKRNETKKKQQNPKTTREKQTNTQLSRWDRHKR